MLQKLALQWHTQSAESKKHVTLPLANKKTDEYNMMHGQSKIQPIPLQLYMNVGAVMKYMCIVFFIGNRAGSPYV